MMSIEVTDLVREAELEELLAHCPELDFRVLPVGAEVLAQVSGNGTHIRHQS